MNERDKELADEAEAYADRDFKGEINWGEAYESKLIALIRADAMETANRAATASWTLMCKKMVEFEREACAKLAEQYGPNRPIVATQPSERIKGRWEGEQAASSGISAAIRERGNT